MEFHSLKRRELQILCKNNNIPANTTNSSMADALASLPFVKGIEQLLGQAEAEDVSPQTSVITSPNMPPTSTRPRLDIHKSQCSKLATRTRCSTRTNAAQGTDCNQTPATRTTRRTARKIQHDIQAEYEASLGESQVSQNKQLLYNECESVQASKVSGVVYQDDNASSENQIESQGQAYYQEEVVNEAQEVSSVETLSANLKVDFHNLSRKQLQNLCKRNKIPANITNAAMIDALEDLESVEGLEDILKDSDPFAVKSPETFRMTSSRARQSRTTQKSTRLKTSQTPFALGKTSVQKKDDSVVQSLAEKMDSTIEDMECSVSISTAEDVLSKEVAKDGQTHLEAPPEKLDVLDGISENDSGIEAESKSSEEISDGPETSIVVETLKEPLDDMVDKSLNPPIILTSDDALVLKELEANELVEFANNESSESNTVLFNHANSDEGESQLSLDEVSEEPDTSHMMKTIKEYQDDVISNEIEGGNDSSETEVHDSGFKLTVNPVEDQKASDVVQEEITLSEALCFEKPIVEGNDIENVKQLGYTLNEIDEIEFDDMSTTDSNVVEVLSVMENVESSSKSISNCATQDEGLSLDSDFVQYSMKEQESSSLEINTDKESESCQVKADELIIASFAVANECEVEELEGSCTNDQMTEKFCSKSTTKANEHASKPKGTPLNHKSLRKLKIMLKEKLQTTTLVTSKMEKLRLEENEAPIDISYPDVEAVPEECDGIETSCGVSTIVSGIAEAPVPAVDTGNDDLDEESKQSMIDKTVDNDPIVDAKRKPLKSSYLSKKLTSLSRTLICNIHQPSL